MNRKFEIVEKRLREYWGFKLLNKGTYFKTRYCVIKNLGGEQKWIGYRFLREIEKIYLKDYK
jgi:hypothetical protein